MIKSKRVSGKFKLIVPIAILTLFCISSGCTSQTENTDTNVVTTTTTATPVESVVGSENTLTETLNPEKSTGEPKSLSEIFDGYSDYILELFPDFIPETVKGKIPWEENDPQNPAIDVYTFKDIEEASDGSVYEARIDAKTGKIRSVYESSGYIEPSGSAKLTLGEGEEIAKSFVMKAFGKGPDDVGDPENKFSIVNTSNYVGLEKLKEKGRAAEIFVRYYNMYEGLNGGPILMMTINSISGNVTSCHFTVPDLCNHTFSSSVPSVSFNEAKKIVEDEINTNYPGEIKKYDFLGNESEALSWDTGISVYYDNTTPIRLIWTLDFNVEKDSDKMSDTHTYQAIIDAHTGEVLALHYKDIDIDYLDKYYNSLYM
ncbi:hypothetical protein J2128_000751 [Methanomicrobium sp. W14]|uniref:PepSY domain-containing protein n=1 Tax=Methanomicrobium sp. W14 TaxID=2817839 RepID=UPI001AE2DF0F|nr:PepSY domain-containing protein [Methanomicrobium sp. W14]MBP2132830.1 hypothetical protein [Methanomicrobium sp. W14]